MSSDAGGGVTRERWETTEQIAAAQRRFEADIPGWRQPAAYGLGRLGEDGQAEFAHVNLDGHPLPGVVLATVCGHRGGSASYLLDASALSRAIGLLTPAEAYPGSDHPNLLAWRRLRGELHARDTVIAAFAGDEAGADDDPHVRALRTHMPVHGRAT